MQILLVEDDEALALGILQILKQEGYSVELVRDGEQADHALSCLPYDLVILDLGLPKLDGLDVLARLRKRQDPVLVLILTARNTVDERITGLDLGADDYLSKPFTLPELEARIRALIRRRYFDNQSILTAGPLQLDVKARRVFIGEVELELSKREMALLELLLINAGQVVQKSKFIHHLCSWDEAITPNAIEASISRLRKKLEPFGFTFRTIRGMGYLLEKTL